MREIRGTIVRVGVGGAGVLLALGLLAASPAGATGAGRHGTSERSGTVACFDSSGKTQGRSHSDPDGMTNGGADKPGCPGGFDADQDGNNGCGNDADREDDNNGRCGRQKPRQDQRKACDKPKTTATSSSTTTTTSTTTPTTTAPVAAVESAGSTRGVGLLAVNDAVQPAEAATTTTTTTVPAPVSEAGFTGPAGVEAATMTTPPEVEVLGQTLERPSALARTGAGIGGLALLGGLLCGGGRLAVFARRFLRID